MTGPLVMHSSKTLIEVQTGDHLYGTATPSSLREYRSVFIPSARDILLQVVPPVVYDPISRADGYHHEAFPLHRYLLDLADGDGGAVELLFAPESAIQGEPSPLWHELRSNRDRILGRTVAQSAIALMRQNAVVRAWHKQAEALRIGHQTLELVTTRAITFPRPESEYLRAIRDGAVTYREVARQLRELEEQISASSIIHSEPDHDWIKRFTVDVYREEVASSSNRSRVSPPSIRGVSIPLRIINPQP